MGDWASQEDTLNRLSCQDYELIRLQALTGVAFRLLLKFSNGLTTIKLQCQDDGPTVNQAGKK